jgi:LPXTG-motif cell wall-anchored protein
VATATGADVLGRSVTDDDDATIAVVLPEVIARPVQPQTLPRTGADTDRLFVAAGFLLLLGGALVASADGGLLVVRRRRG